MKEITVDQLKNPQGIIDALTFSSYSHNRNISPNIHPDRWAKIYPKAEAMEDLYISTFKPDTKLIDDIEWDGINFKDHPDYSDAYISRCDYSGREMTEAEIECIDGEWLYGELINHIF